MLTVAGVLAVLLVAVVGMLALGGSAGGDWTGRQGAHGPVDSAEDFGEPATPGPIASPLPVASVAGAIKAGATGDLGIAITGGCAMTTDTQGRLWLKFGLAVNWLGTAGFPATAYQVSAEGTETTTTQISAASGQTVSIGGTPSGWLGRRIVVTVVIDPQRRVPEVNEDNNSATVTIDVPAAAPSGSQEQSVPCTNG